MSRGLSRTSLTSHAHLMREPDPNGARSMAARKWHEDGTVILLPDSIERLSWQDRELVRAIAGKIYGARGSGRKNTDRDRNDGGKHEA